MLLGRKWFIKTNKSYRGFRFLAIRCVYVGHGEGKKKSEGFGKISLFTKIHADFGKIKRFRRG